MKKEWRKAYWDDVKCFFTCNFEKLFYFTCFTVITCCLIIMTCKFKSQSRKVERVEKERDEWVLVFSKLQKEHLQLLGDHKLTVEEVQHLQNENKIFGSILGTIENKPGGSKILKNIFN